MSIAKLKTLFTTGAWLPNYKSMFTKINEIIDYLNGIGKSGDGSYKVYTALLTQFGSDTPSVIILKNTLGEITTAYNSTGNFSILSDNLFTTDKTVVIHKSLIIDDPALQMLSYILNNSEIQLYTYNDQVAENGILYNPELLEIRVYN